MNDKLAFKEFKSDNKKAIIYLLLPSILLVSGIILSYSKTFSIPYFFSQLILSIFFFQCFILLHEAGHYSFFKTKFLNKILGNVCALISFIPFASWIEIHNLHHKWTGYRDKDPTTEGTISPKFNVFNKLLINLSWLLWFPLFTIGYRLGNYWNIKKMRRHLHKSALMRVYLNMVIQISIYIPLYVLFGSWFFEHLLIAYFISLMISDLFILSQHSHIEIPIAGDKKVIPIKFSKQLIYTRSVTFITILEKLIFLNFNLHELHHNYPGIPAYMLDKITKPTPNKVKFIHYLIDSKSLSGIKFIFNTSKRKIGHR